MVDELTLGLDTNKTIITFPNPAIDEINVIVSDDDTDLWQFYIVDSRGMIVQKSNQNLINISNLSIGHYFIYGVSESSYVKGAKFIKK